MKKILITFLICSLAMTSCVERGKPVKNDVVNTEGKTSEAKVDHFKCPNGHKGSEAQGVCPECSTPYVHNQAYHRNDPVIIPPPPPITDPSQKSAPATTPPPSPAKNAYGDYHYICPNGHDGGSGIAETCGSCSSKLVHNQAYHKQTF